MCKTEPVMRVSQTRGATALAIPRPNARSSHAFVTPFCERRRIGDSGRSRPVLLICANSGRTLHNGTNKMGLWEASLDF